MARLSSDGKYVIVEKGDTLSAIAKKYGNGKTYQQLAAINNISNPNKIAINQKIYLSKTTGNSSGGSSTTTKKPASSKVAKINNFGLQSDSDNTLFATWKWDKSNTEEYSYQWSYTTGDGVWFVGSKSTTKDKQCTYSMPNNAKRVRFRVKPISKKYKKNNKETSYWTADWCAYKYFDDDEIPPEKPSAPSVKIEKYKLTASLDNISSDAKQIEFQVVKNDKKTFKTGTATIKTKHAEFSCTVDAGGEYKVRCRAIRDKLKSDWSDYSSNEGTIPSAPAKIKTIKALSETSVQIDWENVKNAKTYVIEYTTQKKYFDSSNEVHSITINATAAGHAEITGLETGKEHFFRVKATNDKGDSAWTEIKSIVIGKEPSAPTTWSSTTTATTVDPLKLFWVHNAQDNSSQTYAKIKLIIDGVEKIHAINAKKDYENDGLKYVAPKDLEEGEVVTSECSIDTSKYSEDTKIEWCVQTAGITNKYSEWSVPRTIDIYAPPTVTVELKYENGDPVETLESFPFYISAVAGETKQKPIGYYVNITADEYYESVDNLGNPKIINEGDSVYSKYFDINTELLVEMSAHNVNLDNDIGYTVQVTMTMDSGLTAETKAPFDVNWTDPEYEPNAEISIDPDEVTASIMPKCESVAVYFKMVDDSSGEFVLTDTIIEADVYGEPVEGAKTTTGEQVFEGTTDEGDVLYYCEIQETTLVENVTLSVYRKEFDGTFTEIATGVKNNTTVPDPHPSLDYARYRIIAVDDATGAVSFNDISEPVGEKAVIIQWDEDWSEFNVTNEDALEQPSWAGSLLRLPYNIDVSDKYDRDVTHVKYIGRKRSVGYYGTHLGEGSTWNVAIAKDDIDTIYALRRLAIWMGDVYVREPSGTGYWATVSVSMPIKHLDLTIPVTLDITRVEGGK